MMRQKEGDYEEFLEELVSYLREPICDRFDLAKEAEIKKQLMTYEQDPFFVALLELRLSELFAGFEE